MQLNMPNLRWHRERRIKSEGRNSSDRIRLRLVCGSTGAQAASLVAFQSVQFVRQLLQRRNTGGFTDICPGGWEELFGKRKGRRYDKTADPPRNEEKCLGTIKQPAMGIDS